MTTSTAKTVRPEATVVEVFRQGASFWVADDGNGLHPIAPISYTVEQVWGDFLEHNPGFSLRSTSYGFQARREVRS